MRSLSHAPARVRGPVAPERDARSELELVRAVELLRWRGHEPDTIERYLASWLRHEGKSERDIRRATRLVGLPLLSPSLVARIDRRARRPEPGPIQTEPAARFGQGRDDAWFAEKRRAALYESWAINAQGFATVGVLAPRPTPIDSLAPPSPGVYTIQLCCSDDKKAGDLGPKVAKILSRLGPGRRLATALADRLEERLDALGRHIDMDKVRIHEGAVADTLCRELGAYAFAVGRHVAFRNGRFRPDTEVGLALLAHELVHVWQQATGIAKPSRKKDARLEEDAEDVARQVAGGEALQEMQDDEPFELYCGAMRFIDRTGAKPRVIFCVSDVIVAYDPKGHELGQWRITSRPRLRPGYWFDARAHVASWAELTAREVGRLTRGRPDDFWAVGAQHR